MKQELLAPAGDVEAGYAAIYYGADAVYLGLKQFSARATATNFDEDELNNFVGYAHRLNRKVYTAINTLVQQDELCELIKALDICSRCRVDGVILQDLGVAEIIKEQYPELELHASTQMAIHNKQGALALQKYGFKRVVLARELSLNEIKDIASIPNLETEAFIHGALCYSYSGMCLFSSLETSRSANRGKCLYPCRSLFKGEGGEKHYFSMKDMALQEDILKLPVTSLKIEGRKKNALYVAAVTDYYRHILDGKGAITQKAENIKQIFSRPWCKFMLHGKDKQVVDRDFVGHRGLPIGQVRQVAKGRLIFKTNHKIARYDGLQIDIAGQERPFGFSIQNMTVGGNRVFEAKPQDEVTITLPSGAPSLSKGQKIYLASACEVKGGYDYTRPKAGEYIYRYGLDIRVDITAERIVASTNGIDCVAEGKFEPATDVAQTTRATEQAFAKTGGTEFSCNKIIVNNPQKLFVPVSVLNDLRRRLLSQVVIPAKHGQIPDIKPQKQPTEKKWIIRTDNIDCLALVDLSQFAEIEILLNSDFDWEKLKLLPKAKIRLVLPALARNQWRWAEIVAKLIAGGYKKWTAENYWALAVLPEKGIDLAWGESLYVMNSVAVASAQKIGATRCCLSPEDTLNNMKSLTAQSPLPLVMPIYTDVPLFSSAVCIRENDCNHCPKGRKWLTLQKDGKTYRALSVNCQTYVFDDRALCFAREATMVTADFYRVDFCYKNYTAEQVWAILSKLRQFEDVKPCNKGNILSAKI